MTIDIEAIRSRNRDRYFETGRDKILMDFLQKLVRNSVELTHGHGSHRRALFVIGASGSGKTRSIKRALDLVQEWQPFENEFGENVNQMICITPPQARNMRTLCKKLLSEMGVPAEGRKSEPELFMLLEQQLKERRVKVIWIDEMQDVTHANSPKTIQTVQDFLKAIVQIDDWPMHLILSGVAAASLFLQGDQQLARRSYVMRYEPMECPEDADWIRKIITCVVEEDCGLKCSKELLTEEFLERLCHAANGAFGTVVEFVQEACFLALDKRRTEVKISDFAKFYGNTSGCLPIDNVFSASNWRDILPPNALADQTPPPSPRRGRSA